jgi:hypothetical protein
MSKNVLRNSITYSKEVSKPDEIRAMHFHNTSSSFAVTPNCLSQVVYPLVENDKMIVNKLERIYK